MWTDTKECIHCTIAFIYCTEVARTNLWHQRLRQWCPKGGEGVGRMWHYGQVTHLTKAQLPCLYSRKVHDNLHNFLAHSVAYSQSLVSIDIINSQWCNGSPIGFSNSKGPFQLCHLPSPLSAHLLVTWKLFSFPLLPHQSQSPLISSLECISFLYPMA